MFLELDSSLRHLGALLPEGVGHIEQELCKYRVCQRWQMDEQPKEASNTDRLEDQDGYCPDIETACVTYLQNRELKRRMTSRGFSRGGWHGNRTLPLPQAGWR